MAAPLSNEQVEEAFSKAYARRDVRHRRSKEAIDEAMHAMKKGEISADDYPNRVRDHMEHNMVRDGKLPAPPTRDITKTSNGRGPPASRMMPANADANHSISTGSSLGGMYTNDGS